MSACRLLIRVTAITATADPMTERITTAPVPQLSRKSHPKARRTPAPASPESRLVPVDPDRSLVDVRAVFQTGWLMTPLRIPHQRLE